MDLYGKSTLDQRLMSDHSAYHIIRTEARLENLVGLSPCNMAEPLASRICISMLP
jgi:hypothetical protein